MSNHFSKLSKAQLEALYNVFAELKKNGYPNEIGFVGWISQLLNFELTEKTDHS